MKKGLHYIKDLIETACNKAGFEVNPDDIHLEVTKTSEHGHFSTNVAMLLAGKLGKNPRDIAEILINKLQQEKSEIEKVEIAGPGFINFWMDKYFYHHEIYNALKNLDEFVRGHLNLEDRNVMTIDYSSPNIAKPLGVHHLLSTIIGDSIKRIYLKGGYEVIADNYLGDMGTQFGKLIYAIKHWGDEEKINKDPINELLNLYVMFHNEAEKDKTIEDEGRLEFRKFEEGDEDNRKLWKKIVEWSLLEINPLYDRLGIEFDEMHGESFYEDKMEVVLKEGRDKKVFIDGNNGAWIVMPDDPNDPPAIVKKSDGSSIYLTRDLTQTAYWEKTYHPNLMVWVVDVAQSLHFRQRFHASRKLGQTTAEMVHVDFGRMQFKDGSMSTRKGNIVRLSEVLDEAEKRAYLLAKEKGLELSDDQIKELARIMGIGAVKYNILSQNRKTNITFDWDKMLTFEGNSAPYLMYTATRANSVIQKSGESDGEIQEYNIHHLNSETGDKILIHLMMYPEAIKRAMEEFKPNHIANYLYQLAQDFNHFYNGTPILKADEENKKSRLLLTLAVKEVLKDGLNLLGIEVPEKM